jgi:Helicase HerA, central domain
MRARWRLGLLLIEILVLEIGTYLAVGEFVPREVWYASGLLAVIINPLLLEPFYPRPYDVLANALFGILLYAWSPRDIAEPGWSALLILLISAALLATLALVFGAGRREAPRFAHVARVLSSYATSRVIFSSVFWLSLLEQFRPTTREFWTLGFTWALVILLGRINWQQLWESLSRAPASGRAQGLVGPSTLAVASSELPSPGAPVQVDAPGVHAEGIVITRIPRLRDVWGQVHLLSSEDAHKLLRKASFTIRERPATTPAIIGSVGAGSTDRSLVFTPAAPLEVGNVVAVLMGEDHLMYQVESAKVDEMKVKGGSHLITSAVANQIGRFDTSSLRLIQHRWIPPAGAPVLGEVPDIRELPDPPENLVRLGWVIGTNVPVYLDLGLACEGHIVILGMTKMGKTTLGVRLANALAQSRGVVILDQTGEYRSRRGLAPHTVGQWAPGVSVHEPPQGAVGPDFAREFIEETAKLASGEYETDEPTPRSVIFEEAHQFIPEPAGLSFNTPGRESAYQLGVHIMQLRKYGISIMLISQRTAVVAKSALSQCETMIAFRSVDQTGLDYLEQVAGGGVRQLLPALKQGEALVLGTAVSSDRAVAISVES